MSVIPLVITLIDEDADLDSMVTHFNKAVTDTAAELLGKQRSLILVIYRMYRVICICHILCVIELLQIKVCIFEYSREATILHVCNSIGNYTGR